MLACFVFGRVEDGVGGHARYHCLFEYNILLLDFHRGEGDGRLPA
jgi:hypothetical protein